MSDTVRVEDFTPRTVSGARLWPIGEYACAVVMDEQGREVTERHEGNAYVAFNEPSGATFLFADHQGGRVASFTITQDTVGRLRAVVLVEDEETFWGAWFGDRGRWMMKRDTVNVDFGEGYDAMR